MQLSNSAEILPRVASGREQEAASENTFFFADYQNFRTVTLIPLALAGIDARAPFFSRRIRWTPPSFPWHNRVSAWLSLRVRASDYGWCPNIDRFLYLRKRTVKLHPPIVLYIMRTLVDRFHKIMGHRSLDSKTRHFSTAAHRASLSRHGTAKARSENVTSHITTPTGSMAYRMPITDTSAFRIRSSGHCTRKRKLSVY